MTADDLQVNEVGILGSGIMAAGLAELAASVGYRVVVRARTREGGDALVAGIGERLSTAVDKGRCSPEQRVATMARLRSTGELADLASCGLVIESVVEDLAVKKAMFTELGKVVRPDCVLATNTSTLPVVEFALLTGHPERVCGIHFFNPVHAMRVVEVARPITASDRTIAVALAFVAQCGKEAVQVKDRAGFVVNALLFPYLNNAVRMWEQGTATVEDIDRAMRGACNFPMGPFALLDLVGLDTSVAILDALHAEFADPNYAPVPILRRMVAAGQLGRKSGRGFYSY